MKLTPVESSHIAAIGYLEDECVIFLRYRDGTLYAMPGMPPRVWDALCAAESKGRYVERLREPMVRILKGGSTGDREPEQQCGAGHCARQPFPPGSPLAAGHFCATIRACSYRQLRPART